MKVNLKVSHPANNRTKVKMAKVDGCTFFRKGDSWRHVQNSCYRIDHWIWNMLILIGQCTLIREGWELEHKDESSCSAMKAWKSYLEAVEKFFKILVDEKATEEQKAKARDEVAEMEMERPLCDPSRYDIEPSIETGDCRFVMDGGVFKHQHDGPDLRCKKREHFLDFVDLKVRLTHSPGWKLEEFVKKANEAIGQALATVPPNPHQHITVEV